MNALKVQMNARLITMQSILWCFFFICVSLPILAKSISKTVGCETKLLTNLCDCQHVITRADYLGNYSSPVANVN